MDELPWNLRDLLFDHDAAFRARWAVDELVARIHAAAEHRARVAADILCRCQGPFVAHLRQQVDGAAVAASDVVAGLRRLQAQIDDAREAALVEDVRRQLARSEWEAEQALTAAVEQRAGRALAQVGSTGSGASTAAAPPR